MNLKTTLIQNWNIENQQDLYEYILSNVQELSLYIKDIAVAGSRIGGWALEKSDIDAVVFIDDNIVCPKPKIVYFNGIRVCIYIKHGNIYSNKKVYGKFCMPIYSLKTKKYIKGNDRDIEEYLNWKFKIKRR